MRVLVTGASGFAGGAVVRHLLAGGHEVRGLSRTEAGLRRIEALGAEPLRATLSDPNILCDVARGCQGLVHAAGIASPRAAPEALYWTHVAGTENVLRAAEHAGVRRLVAISCADATLQIAPRLNWDEDRSPQGRPLGHRARSLQLAEEAVVGACRPPAFQTIVLRAAWLWGAGDESFLPTWVAWSLQRGGVPMPGGGNHLMPTTHVENLAHAARRALEVEDLQGHGVLHVLDAELLLAGEFLGALGRAAGLPAPRRGGPRLWALAMAWLRERFGTRGPWLQEIVRWAVPCSLVSKRAREALGYEPIVRFEEGVEGLAEWVRALGGPDALLARRRPPPGREAVVEQMRMAGTLD